MTHQKNYEYVKKMACPKIVTNIWKFKNSLLSKETITDKRLSDF